MLTEKNKTFVATQTTTGNIDSNNNAHQRSENKQNNNYNNRRGLNSAQLTNHITREGDNIKVNGVVGMKIEKNHRKVLFETYKDKIMSYVISNYKNGGDINLIFKKLEVPINTIAIKNKHKSLVNTAYQTENNIQRERIKQFVLREYRLRSNMEKNMIFIGTM